MAKGSDLLVAALENEGVDRIFGVPGEENLDVIESLRNSSIKLILTRHEQGAAFMAATYGRLTGKPGICITTLGPGALNLTTGAAYALLGGMPMIMLTGQKGIMSSRQAKFQIVDVVSAFKPLTKLSVQIVSPSSIPTIVRDAFRIAMEERPGPVLLELPEDIAGEETDDIAMVPQHPIEIPVAHRASLDRAAEMILKAAALSERDYVHEAVDRADLIIAIGHDTIEKPPFIMGPKGPQVIHVSYTPANVEQVYFPQCEVVGDVGPSLELLADRVEGRLHNAGALLSLREGILSRIIDRATEDRWPPTPQRIVHDVRKVIPEDGIVALDNGMYKIWFARNYRTYVANTLLLDNALATMGAGLPSAMMAAMLYPERRVLAVCGDGGFMMNSQELETAVRLKLNLVVLILEDSAYGMIRWKQAVDSFPDFGLTFGNPDFVKYAESYGAKGSKVESTAELIPTLERAFKSGGVHLISVPIDYSENTRVLVDELREKLKKVDEPVA
jgi:acetolactate synthase I/II/III large subunit